MFRRSRPLGLLRMGAGLLMAGGLPDFKLPRNYGPCIGCGNPAKGHQCHKCVTAAAAHGLTLQEKVAADALLQEANKSGETESAPQENDSPNQEQVGIDAEPSDRPDAVAQGHIGCDHGCVHSNE